MRDDDRQRSNPSRGDIVTFVVSQLARSDRCSHGKFIPALRVYTELCMSSQHKKTNTPHYCGQTETIHCVSSVHFKPPEFDL